ncbi:MAG: sigma-70 family RNA polymerase sigma factor [Planctomycetaceae bacterium]
MQVDFCGELESELRQIVLSQNTKMQSWDTDDVVQQAMLQVLTKVNELDDFPWSANRRSYLRKVVKHVLVDRHRENRNRSLRRYAETWKEIVQKRHEDPCAQMISTENVQQVKDVLSNLDRSTQRLLKWLYIDDLSIAQISKRLKASPAVVAKRITAARTEFRRLLKRS